MRKITPWRISLVFLVSFLLFSTSQVYAQNSYTLRFGTILSEKHARHQSYVLFKEKVEEWSKGKLKVVVYPNMQMGNEREMTEQVKMGALEMTTGGGGIQGYVPEVGLFYLPFLYVTNDHFVKAWDIETSPIAQKVAKMVVEKTGTIRCLSYLPSGATRNLILRSKPVNTLQDFKGVKIRVDKAPTSFTTMTLLGSSPVPMAFNEVYNALQTGVIDAAENSVSTMLGMKWAEVCKYVSMTDHNRTLHLAMINEKFYQSLPEEFQGYLNKAAVLMAEDWNKQDFANVEKDIEKLKSMGLKINKVQDPQKWIEAASPMQDDWAKKNNFQKELEWVRNLAK